MTDLWPRDELRADDIFALVLERLTDQFLLTTLVADLPSAEGPSLRSDPRWTAERARRAERLLGRLAARRRGDAAHPPGG